MTHGAAPASLSEVTIFDALGRPNLAEMFGGDSSGPGTLFPGWVDTPDGWPIVGVEYYCDSTGQEEHGAQALVRAIVGDDPRNFTMIPEAADRVAVFEDVNGFVLSRLPLGLSGPLRWGDPLDEPEDEADYALRFARSLPGVQDYPGAHILAYAGVKKLRELATALGVSPMPRLKADLLRAVLDHPTLHGLAVRPHRWPAYFVQGTVLVIRADHGPVATIVDRLKAAVLAGTISVGEVSGSFSRRLFISDGADMGPAMRAQIDSDFDEHDRRMAAVAHVMEALERDGIRIRLGRTSKAGDGTVTYWVSGFVGMHYREIFAVSGWYTAEQLQERVFIDDARREAGARRVWPQSA